MRLGCYGLLDNHETIGAAGFDYLEINVQSVLRGDEPSSIWESDAPDPDQLALPVEVASGLLPKDRVVVGSRRNLVELQNYLQRVAKRAQRLGIGCLVFDRAELCQRPADIDLETAWKHIEEFIQMAGEVCAHHDCVLVVEPIEKVEPTGMINALDQVRSLCERVNLFNVGIGVDSEQFIGQKESDDSVIKLGDRLKLVHVGVSGVSRVPHGQASDTTSSGQPRPKPLPLIDQASYVADLEYFICVLRKTGYEGRVTFRAESDSHPIQAIADQLRWWRTAWDRAGQFEG